MTFYTCVTTTADIAHNPDDQQAINKNDSQLLFGESFHAQEKRGDYIYGRSTVCGYEGHVHQQHLSPLSTEPTHVISAPLTHIYPTPDFKTRPLMPLSFMSRVNVVNSSPSPLWTEIEWGDTLEQKGWVFNGHISPAPKAHDPDLRQDDTVKIEIGTTILKTAKQFIGTPYLYGGRSALGIDCAGLVQICLLYHGIPCPRDSKDQEPILGQEIDQNDIQTGDFVFFKGHVGIAVDKNHMLNATARTMDTRIETFDLVMNHYKEITSVKRL